MATHQDTRINEQRIQDAAEKLVSQRTAAQTWSNVKTAAGVGAVIGSLVGGYIIVVAMAKATTRCVFGDTTDR